MKKLSILLLLGLAGSALAMDVTEYVAKHGPIKPLGENGSLVILSARDLTSLKGLDKAVSDPAKIETLKVHWNGIPSVEEDLAPFTGLKHLVLSHNPIVDFRLNSEILKKLKLKHCGTKTVAGDLPSLKKLVVSNPTEVDFSGLNAPKIGI